MHALHTIGRLKVQFRRGMVPDTPVPRKIRSVAAVGRRGFAIVREGGREGWMEEGREGGRCE